MLDLVEANRSTETVAIAEKPRAARVALRSAAGLLSKARSGHGALALFDQAVYSGTSFATTVLIARLGSREELGLYALALTIVFFVRGLQEQLVMIPYRIFCHHREGRSLATYSGSILVHQALLSLLAILALGLALVCAPSEVFSDAYLRAARCALAAILFLLTRECIRQMAFAHLKVRMALVLDITVCVLQLAGLLALGYWHWLTVGSAYLVLGAAALVAVAGWFWWLRGEMRFQWRSVVADWKSNWSLARWALATLVVALPTPFITAWLLAAWRSTTDVGIYAATASLVGISQMLLTGLSNWLTPQVTRAFAIGGIPELKTALKRTVGVYLWAIGACTLVLIAAGGWLLTAVYGQNYAGYGSVVAVGALAIFAHALGNAAGNGLWAMQKPRAHFRADLAITVVTIAVALLTIGPLGPLGAALAAFAGASAGAAQRSLSLFRHLSLMSRETA